MIVIIPIRSTEASFPPHRSVVTALLLFIGDKKYVDCSPPPPFFICSTKKSPFCVEIAI